MASTDVSIKQLPTIDNIDSGDTLIVQTQNATSKIDFKDFVIGLENTTFRNTIETNSTNIETNSTNIEALSSTFYENIPTATSDTATHGISITIGGTQYKILLAEVIS